MSSIATHSDGRRASLARGSHMTVSLGNLMASTIWPGVLPHVVHVRAFFPRRAPNSENLLASTSGGSSRGISCLWMILGRRVLQRVCPAYLLPLVSCGSLSRFSLSSLV